METVVNSFLAAIGAGILSIIALFIKWMWKKFKADDLTIKALAHDAYFRQARYLLSQDFITEEQLENHDYLWQAYVGQGLNGTGKQLHEKILQMEVRVDKSI